MSENLDNTAVFAKSIMDLTEGINSNPENKFNQNGRTIVGMNQGKIVESSVDDTQVFTYGVGSCNAVAIEGVCKDKRFGAITHYDPLNIQNNLLKISQLGEQIGKSGNPDEVNAELFVRGDWVKINDKWEMKPKSLSEVERLTQSVKKAFGENTSIKISPYSEFWDAGKKNQGQVIVNISESSQNVKRIFGIF